MVKFDGLMEILQFTFAVNFHDFHGYTTSHNTLDMVGHLPGSVANGENATEPL